jgi:hypothetical protein
MATLIVRAQGEVARRDQFIDIVTSRMQYSESYFSGIRQRLPRLYDLWRGVYTGRFHPHKNNVHIPIIFSHIWADAARKAATSLNAWPIVNFLGYGPDDMPTVRKREALISAQMKDAGAFLKEVDTFVTADLYGVAISQLMWDHTVEKRIITDSVELPLSGEIVRQIRKMDVITFDGPNWENVDRLDFFPAPGFKTIKKMPWVIRRYFLDVDDLRMLAARGMFDNVELDRLIREGGAGSAVADEASYVRRFQVRSGMSDSEARWMDKFSRPIEILEMWGRVPSELSPDGVLDRVISVANRRYLMRNRPNPFWHGRKPFISFAPMPDPHYFDAPGKAEVTEKLQITANRFVNQKLDAQELVIDPMWFYNRQAGLVTRGLYSKPGRFIGVDGDPSAAVHPFTANMQGLQQGERAAEEMRRYAEMGTGMDENSVQGLSGGDRQTAREFVGRREAAGTRLLLESRIYEEGYLEPLANMMVSLNKQFLELPKEVLVLGDSAIVDPVTGEQITATREVLDGHDLTPDYAARASGASTSLSRGVRQQNLTGLFQYAINSPDIMGATNVVNFWRMMLREFEVPNINEIVSKQPQLQQALAQAGGAAGAAGVPTSGQMATQGMMPQGLQGGGMTVLPGQGGMPADLAGALA